MGVPSRNRGVCWRRRSANDRLEELMRVLCPLSCWSLNCKPEGDVENWPWKWVGRTLPPSRLARARDEVNVNMLGSI
jgi:hypothetical protein